MLKKNSEETKFDGMYTCQGRIQGGGGGGGSAPGARPL
jgi:hypothetical protein